MIRASKVVLLIAIASLLFVGSASAATKSEWKQALNHAWELAPYDNCDGGLSVPEAFLDNLHRNTWGVPAMLTCQTVMGLWGLPITDGLDWAGYMDRHPKTAVNFANGRKIPLLPWVRRFLRNFMD